MLPKCVLCAPARQGRQHRKAVAAYTLDRLHRWHHGERLSLWDSRSELRKGHAPAPSPEQRRALATSLAREGFDRKACAALLCKGLCAPTAQTAEALRALHPYNASPAVPSMNELPLAPEIATELVARCLRAFPADTAPGPTGLRAQHLKDANVAGHSEAFLSQLTAVVALLAQGRAPDFVAPVLELENSAAPYRKVLDGLGARRSSVILLASPSWSSGSRWCREGHPYCAGLVSPPARFKQGPAEADFRNAFNTVNRGAVLSAVQEHFPSFLQFDEWVVESASGVQGDPPWATPLLRRPATHCHDSPGLGS